MSQYCVKYWLYKQDHWIISILVILIIAVLVIAVKDIISSDQFIKVIDFRVWVAIIVGLITLLFAFMRQKHNDLSVFFSMFEKFNRRYDELNNYLNTINKVTSNNMLTEDSWREPFGVAFNRLREDYPDKFQDEHDVYNILDDYLNLCAEEYLAYRNGYVPPEVLKYWVNGMNIFFNNRYMRDYFSKELNTNSYYQFSEFAIEHFDLEK